MAKQNEPNPGSWLLAQELYGRGDPAFVDELRRISAPDRLAAFAEKWLTDPQPAARRLLLDYLNRPLNAFRHEPLVKRLFKLAEKAGDDGVMSAMLTALDRSVRRLRRKHQRYDWQTRESWTEESIVFPRRTTLPKDPKVFRYRDPATGERLAAPTSAKQARLRLFSPRTRHYLRRRAWRYFRALGKQHPDRYRAAMVECLCRYTAEDVADGLALLDNWGLIHVLFHHSPAIVAKSNGWVLAEGRSLNDLSPAPACAAAWTTEAAPLIALLHKAQCRTVRQWTLQMLAAHHPDALSRLPLRELLAFLSHEDDELSQLAAEALRKSPELDSLSADDWLKLLDDINPQSLEVVCDLMAQRLRPDSVSLEQAVRLACSRPTPVARLGFGWLQARTYSSAAECRTLLRLAEAESIPLRPDMVRWLQTVLGPSPYFDCDWILELLDSRHADVRVEGWTWFLAEPRASQDVALWQKLLESPYDDLRLHLIELLDEMSKGQASGASSVGGGWDRGKLDPVLVRGLWATVLLNIHRGGRAKPRVVNQIVKQLERRPAGAAELLPILAVALRSVRGPEWRAGLAAVVRLVDQRPELQSFVKDKFPELQFAAS